MKRAVIYVRVSSKEQAEGGYSIQAQTEACRRFVLTQGWFLAEEYVDQGESARTADRPQFQRMLSDLAEHRDISVVVVHKLDRLARNLSDHVTVRAKLDKLHVRLISVSEKIEESASGQLFEGILASLAQFYSANLGQEVKKGMFQKARNGLWPSIAPIGYLNHREDGSRRAESVLIPDPKTAPLVREAFELYATGEWSITSLHGEMTRRGLKTRNGRPLARSKIASLLRNKIYAGAVIWGGVEVPGQHKPLVTADVFEKVQAVIDTHDLAGVRERRRGHYLKGSLYCGTCNSRLGTTLAKGGRFEYFFCIGRHRKRTACAEPYASTAKLEKEIEALYGRIELPEARRQQIERSVEMEIGQQVLGSTKSARRHQEKLMQLDSERQKLIQAFYADAIPVELLRTEQQRIDDEVRALKEQIGLDRETLEHARKAVEIALRLIDRCDATFRESKETSRRRLNQVFFERIYVSSGEIRAFDYREPFKTIFENIANAKGVGSLPTPVGVAQFEQRPSGEPPGIRTRNQGIKSPLLCH